MKLPQSNRAITRAQALGAKFHFSYAEQRWTVLDQPGTPLWTLGFNTLERAARAYLIQAEKTRLTPKQTASKMATP